MTTSFHPTYQANGWVGRNSLNVRSQRGYLDGTLGTANVNLQERDGYVRGTISGWTGRADVNVRVQRDAFGASVCSGWVGRDNLYLRSYPQAGGRHQISGNIGQTQLRFERQDRGNYSNIQGWSQPVGIPAESINVQIQSRDGLQGSAMEALYPLLGLASYSIRASAEECA